MIRITVEWTHRGNRLEISGHAGMMNVDKEYDQICCCVSYALQNWIVHLVRLEKAGRVNVTFHMQKGYGSVKATAADGEYLDLRAGFDTILDGLKLLREKYPEAIQITYINNDKEEKKHDGT